MKPTTELVQMPNEKCFKLLMEALDEINLICKFCGKKVEFKNYGIIFGDWIACNDLACQIEGLDEIEKTHELVIRDAVLGKDSPKQSGAQGSEEKR